MKIVIQAIFSALLALSATILPAGAQNAAAPAQPVADLPILGLAQVTIKVSDLDKSRAYYTGVLGFPEAFDLKDASGKISSAYFKVNDDQYLELVPGLKPDDLVRQARLVIQASDLTKLHDIYDQRGLNPSPIAKSPDGNPMFRVVAPNGFPVDFLQYAADSKQGQLRGKMLAPERLSTHLLHAGTMVKDDASRDFFQNKLGFGRMLPGGRGEYIELPASDRNLQTKNPPLDPNNQATLPQYTREVYGAVYHFSLEVPDMYAARQTAQKRGGYDDVRVRAAVGNNRHWLMHLFDPDGTRAEIMSTATLPADVPSFSVMPPGPPGPPILAKAPGTYPWP